MAKDAYARLLKVMQKEASKNPGVEIASGTVNNELTVDFSGISLKTDDFDVVVGDIKSGSDVVIIRSDAAFYLIASGDAGEPLNIDDVKADIEQLKIKVEEIDTVKESVADIFGEVGTVKESIATTNANTQALSAALAQTQQQFEELKNYVNTHSNSGFNVDMVYPIGSIYMSMAEVNPGDLFGGTWERIRDTFLLGAGGKAVGATGGEETHRLTIPELPSHKHKPSTTSELFVTSETSSALNGQVNVTSSGSKFVDAQAKKDTFHHRYETNSIGNSEAHNNMPPFLVVYIWKRTA